MNLAMASHIVSVGVPTYSATYILEEEKTIMGSESTVLEERHATTWGVDLPASASGDQLPTLLCPCTGFQCYIVAYVS